jgi:hypothetical protein
VYGRGGGGRQSYGGLWNNYAGRDDKHGAVAGKGFRAKWPKGGGVLDLLRTGIASMCLHHGVNKCCVRAFVSMAVTLWRHFAGSAEAGAHTLGMGLIALLHVELGMLQCF